MTATIFWLLRNDSFDSDRSGDQEVALVIRTLYHQLFLCQYPICMHGHCTAKTEYLRKKLSAFSLSIFFIV